MSNFSPPNFHCKLPKYGSAAANISLSYAQFLSCWLVYIFSQSYQELLHQKLYNTSFIITFVRRYCCLFFVFKSFQKKLSSIYTALIHQYRTNITQSIITSFTQHLSSPTQIIIPQHAVTSKEYSSRPLGVCPKLETWLIFGRCGVSNRKLTSVYMYFCSLTCISFCVTSVPKHSASLEAIRGYYRWIKMSVKIVRSSPHLPSPRTN